jgi:hypothetical protein
MSEQTWTGGDPRCYPSTAWCGGSLAALLTFVECAPDLTEQDTAVLDPQN